MWKEEKEGKRKKQEGRNSGREEGTGKKEERGREGRKIFSVPCELPRLLENQWGSKQEGESYSHSYCFLACPVVILFFC